MHCADDFNGSILDHFSYEMILPATAAEKIFPMPWSKIIAGSERESIQLNTIAIGFCPSWLVCLAIRK